MSVLQLVCPLSAGVVLGVIAVLLALGARACGPRTTSVAGREAADRGELVWLGVPAHLIARRVDHVVLGQPGLMRSGRVIEGGRS